MSDGGPSLRARLRAGELLVAVEAASASAGAVEVMAGLDFDMIVVDARHAALSPYSGELERVIRAADLHRKPALVRVGENTPGTINRAMNDGAAGVVVAVDDPHKSAVAAKSVRYPPLGFRGAAPVVRAAGFGLTPWDDYREATNADRPVIASIESAEGLEAVSAIAAQDGIDAVLLDTLNLSLSLGLSSLSPPTQDGAIGSAVGELLAAGHVVGVNLASPGDAATWRDAGCTLLVIGTDVGAYADATASLRAELNSVPHRLAEGASS